MITSATNHHQSLPEPMSAALQGDAFLVQANGAARARGPEPLADRISVGVDQLRASVAELARLQSDGGAAPDGLRSALEKLQRASQSLSAATPGQDGLCDALSELLYHQSQQTDQRISLAKGQIDDRFKRAMDQTKSELKAIKERIEASKKSGFWSIFTKVFQVIASVASAVAGVVSGNPLLIAGAVLSFASMITAAASNSALANTLSLVLGLAGAACSLGSGLVKDVAGLSQLADVLKSVGLSVDKVQMAANVVGSTSTGVSAVGHVGRGMAESDAGNALADLAELQALKKRGLKGAEEEREMIATLLDTYERAVSQTMEVLLTHQRAESAAVGGLR